MSVRPSQRTRYSLSKTEPKPVRMNPLGLLIVMKDASRRKPSIGLNPPDGNRSDDNEASAFSYSDDDSDEDLNEDRQAYLSGLNDEYLLALALNNKETHFEPCRKLKPGGGPRRKDSRPARKNVYKRPREEKEISPRKTSVIDDSRQNRNFWSPSSSWSAIGRLFGKLKQGHNRDDERERRLSVQTNSSAADTDDGSEEGHRTRSSSYDDPAGFLKQVQQELVSAARKHSADVSHLKVVSKHADGSEFTVTNRRDSLAVCKEYFSRLSCYDSMPNVSEMAAVDTRTPMEEVINIMRRHHTMGAVMWNSSVTTSDHFAPAQHVRDIGSLVKKFWPYFIDAPPSDVSECVRRPVMDFLASPPSGQEENKISPFEVGVSPELSLIEAARLFCQQVTNDFQNGRRFGRFLLPLVNDPMGDVIHVLSANDILRFLSKELCRFDLLSAFEHIVISGIQRFGQASVPNSAGDEQKRRLYLDNTLKEATSMLIENEAGVLSVFDRSSPAKPSYNSMLSISDVVDLVAKSGYCSDVVLSKCLAELLPNLTKKDVPFFDRNTALSMVLKTVAASTCDDASWESLLPIGVVRDDEGEFAGFLEAEDLLTIVLSLDNQQNGTKNGKRVSIRERRDSGVGDEELLFPDEGLYLSV